MQPVPTQPTLIVKRLEHGQHVELPAYATSGAAGMDLRACLDAPLVIQPQATVLVPTGLAFEIPVGFEGQVRARSGLALKHTIIVVNAPGTIDSDYRGELKVILGNFGREPFTINHGDRIAQLVISPVAHAALQESTDLSSSTRGEGGFGSTGKK